ncbi:hypothetical protein AcW1_007881 [Taiwanofungus camphoratus]|nr:hypothetical protein AcW1_007881 [Antrodia cinnamomea]
MLFFFFALVGVLALGLGPQVTLAHFDFVTFSSVQQCTPFHIQFSGGQSPASLPLTLTVVPLNSTPVSIPIPSTAWNDTTETGAAITFLPLPAGTDFVASLDDANGVSTGQVSDIIRVGPFNDTSCLPSAPSASQKVFTVQGELSQCEPFNVTYPAHDAAPSIRAFIPKGVSFPVNQSVAADEPGTATYTMDTFHDSQVVLLLSDKSSNETTALLSVGGDSLSNGTCITAAFPSTNATASSRDSMTSNSKGLSKTVIIAIGAASGAVVGGLVLVMALWFYCSRRKAQKLTLAQVEQGGSDMPQSGNEKHFSAQYGLSSPTSYSRAPPRKQSWLQVPHASAEGARYVKNPLYTDSKLGLYSPTIASTINGSAPPSATRSNKERSARGIALMSNDIPSPLSSTLRDGDTPRPSPNTPQAFPSAQLVSRSSPRQGPCLPSPATTIFTTDMEHFVDMSERYSVVDKAEAVPLRPPPALVAERTLRNSAYLAGIESAQSAGLQSPQVRVRPPTLRLHSATSSVVSSVVSTRSGVNFRRSPSSKVYREPPQAAIPSSPTASPLPSPVTSPM